MGLFSRLFRGRAESIEWGDGRRDLTDKEYKILLGSTFALATATGTYAESTGRRGMSRALVYLQLGAPAGGGRTGRRTAAGLARGPRRAPGMASMSSAETAQLWRAAGSYPRAGIALGADGLRDFEALCQTLASHSASSPKERKTLRRLQEPRAQGRQRPHVQDGRREIRQPAKGAVKPQREPSLEDHALPTPLGTPSGKAETPSKSLASPKSKRWSRGTWLKRPKVDGDFSGPRALIHADIFASLGDVGTPPVTLDYADAPIESTSQDTDPPRTPTSADLTRRNGRPKPFEGRLHWLYKHTQPLTQLLGMSDANAVVASALATKQRAASSPKQPASVPVAPAEFSQAASPAGSLELHHNGTASLGSCPSLTLSSVTTATASDGSSGPAPPSLEPAPTARLPADRRASQLLHYQRRYTPSYAVRASKRYSANLSIKCANDVFEFEGSPGRAAALARQVNG